MALLRSERGCPWDREQTHKSLTKHLIEESYEVIEAIDEENDEGLKEELGDVFLQVLFHSQIAEEEGRFNIGDVLEAVANKLVMRHPHVFGDEKAKTAAEVVEKWEKIKKQKKGESYVAGKMPENLPETLKSFRLQEKASHLGFDWEKTGDVREKLSEEIRELDDAIKEGNGIEFELGDVLFAMINLARHLKIDPENALRLANKRFVRRFTTIEQEIKKAGRKLSLKEMDEIWEKAKKEEQQADG